jgi:hypothetical protein
VPIISSCLSDSAHAEPFLLASCVLRFIQIGPFVVRTGRKRRDHPAAVGGRKPKSGEQAGELGSFAARNSTDPELRHRTDNDFHGPAVRVSCDTRRNNLSELVPEFFLLVREGLRWTSESLRNDRFSCSGGPAILVIDERATAFQNGGWCAV